MKIMIDLNVILDVVQKREPHFAASAQMLAEVSRGGFEGVLPSHALTTLYFIINKYSNEETATRTIDWLLDSFDIAVAGHREYLRARTLEMRDFEDAVVVAAALSAECEVVVTRNVADFEQAPIRVLTPEELLACL